MLAFSVALDLLWVHEKLEQIYKLVGQGAVLDQADDGTRGGCVFLFQAKGDFGAGPARRHWKLVADAGQVW